MTEKKKGKPKKEEEEKQEAPKEEAKETEEAPCSKPGPAPGPSGSTHG